MLRRRQFYLFVCFVLCAAGVLAAQSPARRSYDIEFLGPPLADPILQHSKETYVLFGCAYCHGLNLVSRGEATDLMHSALVGRDENGELIGRILRAGIPQTAKLSPMPQFSDLSDQQIADIVRWIHYARQQGRYKELTESPVNPGDAAAGRAYFERACSNCHSVERDLAGIGRKYDAGALRTQILDPKGLTAELSFTVDRLHDTKTAAARQRHHALLENYSASEVANLVTYLQQAR